MTDLNEIPILVRREIEARLAGPLIQAFIKEFGRKKTLEVVSKVILQIAEESGAQLAEKCGGNTFEHLKAGMAPWNAGEALEQETLAQTETQYNFNIRRCKYAEMYKALGFEEWGFILSCGRDGKMFGGFNPNIKFTRTQTIMEGADYCDFRLSLEDTEEANKDSQN